MRMRVDTCSLIARRYFYPEKARKGRKLRENDWLGERARTPLHRLQTHEHDRDLNVLPSYQYRVDYTFHHVDDNLQSARRLIYDLNYPWERTLDTWRKATSDSGSFRSSRVLATKFLRVFEDKSINWLVKKKMTRLRSKMRTSNWCKWKCKDRVKRKLIGNDYFTLRRKYVIFN